MPRSVNEHADEQPALFEVQPDWAAHWQEVWTQRDLRPWQTVMVHFRNREDRQAFEMLIGQQLTDESKYCWFPANDIAYGTQGKRVVSDLPRSPTRHPLYVISKGRWESRLTSKALEALNIPYSIVVEPQEYDAYAAVIDPKKILVLPFSNLGQGSIPARNWVWEHALAQEASHHWILDDNIDGFFKLENNTKYRVNDGNPFLPVEDFVARYTNIGLAGLNYKFFAKSKDPVPPFYLNTRIYSCILINHAINFRWRGRYNEDTDLSLRVLKAGWCTVLLNHYLCDKQPTMTMKGGNTDELYQSDGRLLMAQSLQAQHPDVVTITEKWGRYQHQVNYKPFRRNKLQPRQGA